MTYTSTATAADIARRLKGARHVVVLTHAKPDGDALGSSLAMARLARRLGARSESWFVGPFPVWLETLAGDSVVRKLGEQPAVIDPAWGEPDLVCVVDTGTWVQLDSLREWVKPRAEKALIVDHHLHGNPEMSATRYIDSSAASCTQLVARVTDAALGLGESDPIPLEIAEPAFFGLATDTGWFRFSNTSPGAMRLAARLKESGVDAARLYELSEQQQSPARPRLLGSALSSLEWHAGGTIGVMSITQAAIAAAGAQGEDVGGFAEPVLCVRGVNVVVTLTETSGAGAPGPITKASLRSKPGPGAIDVAAVCSTLGGGGHARAAGAKLHMTLPQAKTAVLKALGA
jgi:phosphoesterase RecJ-like protein